MKRIDASFEKRIKNLSATKKEYRKFNESQEVNIQK
jgi:hypothetical protein